MSEDVMKIQNIISNRKNVHKTKILNLIMFVDRHDSSVV